MKGRDKREIIATEHEGSADMGQVKGEDHWLINSSSLTGSEKKTQGGMCYSPE